MNLEDFFKELCAQLNWLYLEPRPDLKQDLEALKNTGKLIVLTMTPDILYIAKDSVLDSQTPKTYINEVAEGDTRYMIAKLLIGGKRDTFSEYQILSSLSDYLQEVYFNGVTRLRIGDVLQSLDKDSILYRVDVTLQLNNRFQ